MAGGCQASAHLVLGVAHTGLTASPTLDPAHPICHPNPHNISSPVPTPMLGQEVGRSPRSRGHTHLQFFSSPVNSIFPGLWPGQICWFHHVGPSIHPPGPLLTTCCLHPHWAILLTACRLHPCPSAVHSLWAGPGGCPLTPLAP